QALEDHRKSVKLSKNKTSITECNDSLNAKTLNVKSVSAMCDKCVLIDKHDMCVLKSDAKPLKETVASESNKKPRNFTRKLYERVSKTCSWWYPKFTPSGYKWKPKSPNLVEIVLFIVDSGCSKHMTGNLKLLINFVEKFLGTVKFWNDQIAPILGYGDLVQGAVTINKVYYVEGLNHNLFSVGQFCDADLKVAFRKSTCYIRYLKGNDLLTDNDIYSIVDTCPNACEMWKAIERLKQVDACPNACEMSKAIERLKQGESINVQDLETNLFWEFGKFTSLDEESLESYYSRTHQAAIRKREKAIVNSPQPIYDQEPSMVDDDDETSKEKDIDKLMALISLSFKKIYKPTNSNLQGFTKMLGMKVKGVVLLLGL
nr:integrase, catalytic region, zinc finger, CCHC-type, peptidase aspartic, catalytic [Tanacetum cinerariifolium]